MLLDSVNSLENGHTLSQLHFDLNMSGWRRGRRANHEYVLQTGVLEPGILCFDCVVHAFLRPKLRVTVTVRRTEFGLPLFIRWPNRHSCVLDRRRGQSRLARSGYRRLRRSFHSHEPGDRSPRKNPLAWASAKCGSRARLSRPHPSGAKVTLESWFVSGCCRGADKLESWWRHLSTAK